jgi:hypothetical protein
MFRYRTCWPLVNRNITRDNARTGVVSHLLLVRLQIAVGERDGFGAALDVAAGASQFDPSRQIGSEGGKVIAVMLAARLVTLQGAARYHGADASEVGAFQRSDPAALIAPLGLKYSVTAYFLETVDARLQAGMVSYHPGARPRELFDVTQ